MDDTTLKGNRQSGLSSWIPLLLTLWAAYMVGITLYRAFLHPLRKVPGPKAAGATWFPEFYYNIVKSGSYYKKIEEWHEIYGAYSPIH